MTVDKVSNGMDVNTESEANETMQLLLQMNATIKLLNLQMQEIKEGLRQVHLWMEECESTDEEDSDSEEEPQPKAMENDGRGPLRPQRTLGPRRVNWK